MYSNGESERIIAKAIKQVLPLPPSFVSTVKITYLYQFQIPRHRLTILTKCFNLVTDDVSISAFQPGIKDTRDYVNQSGLSRQAIFNQVTDSLARLEMDYVDLLQIHRADLKNVTAEVCSQPGPK
jgi:aryl-alcohol dehydrogenase-like predicted oxidoreductase